LKRSRIGLLKIYRKRVVQDNSIRIKFHIIRKDFQPSSNRRPELPSINRIHIVGGPENFGVRTLNEEKQNASKPVGQQPLHMDKMFDAADGDGIGKSGCPILDQSAALDLQKAGFFRAFQQKIQPDPSACGDLGMNRIITRKRRNAPGAKTLMHDPVGHHRIYADEGTGHLNQLPRISIFSTDRIMKGQIDPAARITAGRHATGVGTMGRDNPAGFQPDIGQKPFVTTDQNPWNQV